MGLPFPPPDAAVFDNDPSKVGRKLGPFVVQPLSDIPAVVQKHGIRLAIMAVPADGLTLEDKQRTTSQLLRAGADIHALHGGGLLASPLDSSSLMRWGAPGPGRWITVYTNPSHAFVEVAGLRLDTSAAEDPSGRSGPQWRPARRSHAGFQARHPIGL